MHVYLVLLYLLCEALGWCCRILKGVSSIWLRKFDVCRFSLYVSPRVLIIAAYDAVVLDLLITPTPEFSHTLLSLFISDILVINVLILSLSYIDDSCNLNTLSLSYLFSLINLSFYYFSLSWFWFVLVILVFWVWLLLTSWLDDDDCMFTVLQCC